MKTILCLGLFLSCLSCAAIDVMAQDFTTLREKAAKIVKAKNSTWKLIRKEERQKQVTLLMGPDKADVMLTIFYGASKEEAAEKMDYTVSHISVGPDKKLTDIGDEAYLWKSYRSGAGTIRFRKSNVYFDLVAPSVALAKELAKSLAQEVEEK